MVARAGGAERRMNEKSQGTTPLSTKEAQGIRLHTDGDQSLSDPRRVINK